MSSHDLNTIGHKLHMNLLKYMFPQVVNGEIDTDKFLKASRNMIKILDKIGKVFAPIKYDMQINIDKLLQRYSADLQANSTLQKMILNEQKTGKKSVATDALLWLTRSLRMIQVLFDKIVREEEEKRPAEDLGVKVSDAYSEILEPHQGWMAQQLFGLLTRMVPTRSQVLLALAEDTPGFKIVTITTLEIINVQLKSNLMVLQTFFSENDLGLVL